MFIVRFENVLVFLSASVFDLLSHERHMRRVCVEFRGHSRSFGDVSTVHQPEPCGHGGRERYAILDECQRR